MLFKLSLKNIKKSVKDYAIYFFTLLLGVAIFYVFNSMDSQTAMLKVSESTHEIMKLMTTLLSGVSVFVSFILGFLIIYASRFLMKRRKKEFGIYMTLGMSKGKISKILLTETLLIGLFSLVIGLVLGIGLSQFMSFLVASMFEADMGAFTFVFSASAMMKTILYFGIIYLMVMLFNTFSVGKCKLIDLIASSKKSEKVKFKNTFLCIIVFIISVITLGIAYYIVAFHPSTISNEAVIPILVMGALGTFFLFWSLSGLILKIVMSFKKLYAKDLNTFVVRQLSSKINTTVFSMTIISLMLFLTIVIFSSALSMKNSMTQNLHTLAPIDFEAYKLKNITGQDYYGIPYTDKEIADSKMSIEETLERYNFSVSNHFKDTLVFYDYQDEKITMAYMLGTLKESIQKEFPRLIWEQKETILRISDYNKVAHLYGKPEYHIGKNEYMIIADFDSMVEIRNKALAKGTVLELGGKTYKPKYEKCQDGFVEMSSNYINTGIILVPDDAVTEEMQKGSYLLANYQAQDEQGKETIENKLQNLPVKKGDTVLSVTTKLAIYEASVGLGAVVTFIGLYLGIIFLLSSAAILALKELSESSDNKERYVVLRKIGASEKMIRKALFRQIAIFFSFPLLVAVIHSIFGIAFANYVLQSMGTENLLSSIIMTSVFLIFIYGGYFLITYFCSRNIISEKE